jgi:hypothetical protein
MILVDRKTTALPIIAVFCLLPTAAAGPSADKPGTGASTGALERLETFTAEQKAHWAYQPLRRPELPDVRKLSWVRSPIDRFILAELESVELPHAPEVQRIALIRRLTFDLTFDLTV